MAIEWEEYLSVGVERIDNQHKEIFRRINSLMDAINQGEGSLRVADAVDFMGEYIATHFHDEELFMSEACYAALDSHRKEHEKFSQDVTMLKKRIMIDGATKMNILKTSQVMISWLVQHILVTDKALAHHLSSSRGQEINSPPWINTKKETI